MKILLISSEVSPFAKTGGLGDVAAALPRALAARGHDVRVAMPLYRRVRRSPFARSPLLAGLGVRLGARRVGFDVEVTTLPGSEVPVYLLSCPAAYDRPDIYTGDSDEHLRFALLGHGALVTCQHLGWAPDVVHVNDWPGGLVPLALRSVFRYDRLFADTRTVLTIHNIGHQGTFDARVLPELGLDGAHHHLHQEQLAEGRLSFLLTGLLYADAITTVSPTYAREIMTPGQGMGLDPFLRRRRDVVFGILNGIDGEAWDPAADPHLPAAYSAEDLSGKAACKAAMLEASRLAHDPGVPVVGVVSRLAWQKGFDLVEHVLPQALAGRPLQVVVLGTGEPRYAEMFGRLADRFPDKVAFHRTFSEPLAHLIEAGSDVFLMPSRYEPCGLNQMYSLRYGTPPIVHNTGGLADTVSLWHPESRTGNGFIFDHFDEGGLAWALHYALNAWHGSREHDGGESWRALQRNGMTGDYEWASRVGAYEQVYELVRGAGAS